MIKRVPLFAWVLCACLLAGCGSGPAAVGRSAAASPSGDAYLIDPEPMASQEVFLSPAGAGIVYTVEPELLEDESRSDDQVKLTSTHYELPVLRALRPGGEVITEAESPAEEQALLVVNTFNSTFDAWRAEDDFVLKMAQEDYAVRPEMFSENGMYYQNELTYTAYTTDRLVSILASSYSYYGGAHPNSVSMAWNYDLDDGAFLSPSSIAAEEPEFEAAVAAELIRQAKLLSRERETEPEDLYWEDYQEILTDWTSYTVSFDQNGMTVSYAPYELSYYAAGPHAFTLSNDFLRPFLSEYGLELLGLDGDG